MEVKIRKNIMSVEISPYSSTISAFQKNGLIIKVSEDKDFENLLRLKLKVIRHLAPTLYGWYLFHPEISKEEFFGPEGQQLEKRIFYTVKDLEGNIVGSGGIIKCKLDKEIAETSGISNDKITEISSIYLNEEYRGNGLGKVLVTDLLNKARELEFKLVYLSTRKEFDIALKMYENLGFKMAKIQQYPEAEKSVSLELML